MNREIKFRVWDKEKKKMGELLSITWQVQGEVTTISSIIVKNPSVNIAGYNLYVNHAVLMQYVGLKDKHNKKIYEGDIVKTPEDYDEFGMQAGEINKVVFQFGGFRLFPKYNKDAKGFWLQDDNTFEVIGNIYENPELLEK